jgi:Arc/MetJ family transcription regulator
MRMHTTINLDQELLRQAAEALGTTRKTDTVHAALREVVARRRRRWLADRDLAGLADALPSLRRPRGETESSPGSDRSAESDRSAGG